ncbi:MAG: hypothetical protein K8S13_08205 [Desulfobacula sp.]|uniref:hypothetical protein n=1 Tax=Desulfobacula sp. TaxID=2593537 RepID=UPI0025C1760C|nr:hypothetical protein [Desulfobacula sp.]MCD4719829.1 hypothetical protein [Desulfobacula sp.]
MKNFIKRQWLFYGAIVLMLLFLKGPAFAADDFFLYGNQDAGDVTECDVQPVIDSWFTALDYFRDGPNEGRMLAATGKNVYIQSAEGSSTWIKIAKVDYTMDPAFIRISPSGNTVALGLGWGQSILVFNASLLDAGTPEEPVDLSDSEEVLDFAENHYDAAWVGEDHIVINGGQWVIPGQSAVSGVVTLNITNETNITQGVCGSIPGASSGIAVDENNNLVFGIGAGTNTGELKIWPAGDWWTGNGPVANPLAYNGPEGLKFAHQVLSAAHLGFDEEGSLHVGGGVFVNPGPVNLESGYAALINHKVMTNALASVNNPEIDLYEVNETNGSQYREFGPDVCRNDTATGVMANGSALSVNWNPATPPGGANCVIGGNNDWWQPGVVPRLTTYKVNESRDGDGDFVADVDDHTPNTYETANVDSDGDGYGNLIDGDFNNDDVVNYSDFLEFRGKYGTNDSNADMNSDGIVNYSDFLMFRTQYGKEAPYYN